MVNTENMNSLSALDHRIMEKFLSLVRPPMRVHQLISRSDIGQQKYNWNLSPDSSGEGSAVSAFSSDKVCALQCKQGASSTSSDHTKGIGIVQLLRGKNFLITGATGFLLKGDSFSLAFDFVLPSVCAIIILNSLSFSSPVLLNPIYI